MLVVGLLLGAPAGAGVEPRTGTGQARNCKVHPGQRTVKLTLGPNTPLGDFIAWISSVTCKTFLLPSKIPPDSKKLTVLGPALITPEEAYRLFLAALDSVALTVAPDGGFLRIVEVKPVKEPRNDGADRYVTLLVRLDQIDRDELARVAPELLPQLTAFSICHPIEPRDSFIITDVPSNIRRIVRIIHR